MDSGRKEKKATLGAASINQELDPDYFTFLALFLVLDLLLDPSVGGKSDTSASRLSYTDHSQLYESVNWCLVHWYASIRDKRTSTVPIPVRYYMLVQPSIRPFLTTPSKVTSFNFSVSVPVATDITLTIANELFGEKGYYATVRGWRFFSGLDYLTPSGDYGPVDYFFRKPDGEPLIVTTDPRQYGFITRQGYVDTHSREIICSALSDFNDHQMLGVMLNHARVLPRRKGTVELSTSHMRLASQTMPEIANTWTTFIDILACRVAVIMMVSAPTDAVLACEGVTEHCNSQEATQLACVNCCNAAISASEVHLTGKLPMPPSRSAFAMLATMHVAMTDPGAMSSELCYYPISDRQNKTRAKSLMRFTAACARSSVSECLVPAGFSINMNQSRTAVTPGKAYRGRCASHISLRWCEFSGEDIQASGDYTTPYNFLNALYQLPEAGGSKLTELMFEAANSVSTFCSRANSYLQSLPLVCDVGLTPADGLIILDPSHATTHFVPEGGSPPNKTLRLTPFEYARFLATTEPEYTDSPVNFAKLTVAFEKGVKTDYPFYNVAVVSNTNVISEVRLINRNVNNATRHIYAKTDKLSTSRLIELASTCGLPVAVFSDDDDHYYCSTSTDDAKFKSESQALVECHDANAFRFVTEFTTGYAPAFTVNVANPSGKDRSYTVIDITRRVSKVLSLRDS